MRVWRSDDAGSLMPASIAGRNGLSFRRATRLKVEFLLPASFRRHHCV